MTQPQIFTSPFFYLICFSFLVTKYLVHALTWYIKMCHSKIILTRGNNHSFIRYHADRCWFIMDFNFVWTLGFLTHHLLLISCATWSACSNIFLLNSYSLFWVFHFFENVCWQCVACEKTWNYFRTLYWKWMEKFNLLGG